MVTRTSSQGMSTEQIRESVWMWRSKSGHWTEPTPHSKRTSKARSLQANWRTCSPPKRPAPGPAEYNQDIVLEATYLAGQKVYTAPAKAACNDSAAHNQICDANFGDGDERKMNMETIEQRISCSSAQAPDQQAPLSKRPCSGPWISG